MTRPSRSSRQMLRSAGIVGAASIVNILSGIVRLKVFALILGPAGVGLAGLFTNLMMLSSTVAGLGIGSSGVRHVASVRGEAARLDDALQALFLLGILLGVLGGGAVYFLQTPLATYVLSDAKYAPGVGWVGLGVSASVAGSVFVAMLQGVHRIGKFSKANIVGNLLGSALSVSVIWYLGFDGIYFAVICLPLSLAAVAFFFVRHLPPARMRPLRALANEARPMLGFGAVMLFSAILLMGTMMSARALINQKLGLEAAGFFHSAWLLSATYIGFALNAMAADFYPRVTAAIAQNENPGTLVGEQMGLAQTLTAPLIVAVIAFAPIIIILLYSREFLPAAEVVRVHVFGDLFRVIGTPFAYTLLAAGAAKRFMFGELVWSVVYLTILFGFIDHLGVVAVGIAYATGYAVHLLVIYGFFRQAFGGVFGRDRIIAIISIPVAAGVVLLAAEYDAIIGYAVGSIAVVILSALAIRLVVRSATDDLPSGVVGRVKRVLSSWVASRDR